MDGWMSSQKVADEEGGTEGKPTKYKYRGWVLLYIVNYISLHVCIRIIRQQCTNNVAINGISLYLELVSSSSYARLLYS
jgi:hypothetical protein